MPAVEARSSNAVVCLVCIGVPTVAFDTVNAEIVNDIRSRFDGVSSLAYAVSESKECSIQANTLTLSYPFNLGTMAFDDMICESYLYLVNVSKMSTQRNVRVCRFCFEVGGTAFM